MKYYAISLYKYSKEVGFVYFKTIHVKGIDELEAFFSDNTESYGTCRVRPETKEEYLYDIMCSGCENARRCHETCENCEEYDDALEGENI